MAYLLNKKDILDLLKLKGYIDNNSSRKSDVFMDFINQYIKQTNDTSVLSKLQLNSSSTNWESIVKLSVEFASALENKIELFSDLYWSLYHYSDSQQNKTIWSPKPHTKKQAEEYVDYLMSFKDKGLLDALTHHMQQLASVNNDMVDVWYELVKDNKNQLKSLPPYNFIIQYNEIDMMDNKVIKKAQLFTLFEHNAAFENIQKLYEKYKKVGVLEKKLYAILQKYDSNYPQHLFGLCETNEEVVYRSKTVFNLEYLLQNYSITSNQGQNFLNVLMNYINNQAPKHYVKPNIKMDKTYLGHNELITMEVVLETYSQEFLDDAKKWLQASSLFAAEHLLTSEYRNNLNAKTYEDNKLKFVDFAIEYIEKGLAMKALASELPMHDIKVSRPKI